MEKFFDLRTFLIFILKRAKVFLLITLLITVVWAGIRAVPRSIQYLTYEETPAAENTEEISTSDLPYRYSETRLLYIEKDGNIDQTKSLLSVFTNLSNTNAVMNQQKELFFAKAKEVDAEDRQKLFKMKYRTKQIFNYPFDFQTFKGYYSVQTDGNNMVSITVTTADKTLSSDMCKALETVLIQQVTDVCGDFSYKTVGTRSYQALPEPDAGLIPQIETANTEVVAGSRPSLSGILKSTIKGAIWGVMAGAMIAVVVLFFMQAVSIKVWEETDLKEAGISVLSVCRTTGKKRRRMKWLDRLIDRLEGRCEADMNVDLCAKMVTQTLQALESCPKNILIAGIADQKAWDEMTIPLRACLEKQNFAIDLSNEALNQPAVLDKIGQADGVIFMEEAGRSTKLSIQRELEICNQLKTPVLGAVLLK